MKSPFPGMDPYLESRWAGAHVLMIGTIATALNQCLPANLEARPEEEIRIESIAGDSVASYRADVAVVQDETPRLNAGLHGSTALAEPIRIPYQRPPLILRNIHIVDTGDNDRIVTAVEVLSPWNKRAGKLNSKYIRKLHDFEEAEINWMEIDLLRGHRRRMIVSWEQVPDNKRADYLVSSYRADTESLSAYPIHLREALPTVPVPLRTVDRDIPLDLQSAVDGLFATGSFRSLDYRKTLLPPLSPADAEWAAGLIADRKDALR